VSQEATGTIIEAEGCCGCVVVIGILIVCIALIGALIRVFQWAFL
jgi:hypothetical protein